MNRIALTTPGGLWFDADKAEVYNEKKEWDGRNHISLATNSQFEHECIYVTKGGRFILRHSSDYQGRRSTYEIIDEHKAAAWFTSQCFTDEEIPTQFLKEVANLEVE